jgi:hypothetical protein
MSRHLKLVLCFLSAAHCRWLIAKLQCQDESAETCQAGAEAYHRDNPRAEVHILDAGHFAMDLKAAEIIQLASAFMKEQGSSGSEK